MYKYRHDESKEIQHTINSSQWLDAHDKLLHHLGPKALLQSIIFLIYKITRSGQNDQLSVYISQIREPARKLKVWNLGVGVYSDFIDLQTKLKNVLSSFQKGSVLVIATNCWGYQDADVRALLKLNEDALNLSQKLSRLASDSSNKSTLEK